MRASAVAPTPAARSAEPSPSRHPRAERSGDPRISGRANLHWGACSLGLLGWRANPGELRALGRVALTAAPFALSYRCWLALLWHGPTETLSGSPSGDLIYYATSISSLSSHPYPHLNLGYERVLFGSYFNMLVPAIGAAL